MLMHVTVPAWGKPPAFAQWKGRKRGVTQILPFLRISEIKSFIIFFPSLQMLSTDV